MGGRSANKAGYFDKLKGLLEEYKSIFIVGVDNVSSQQVDSSSTFKIKAVC
jgi:large subunit ribosomal protein LP0